MKQRRESLPCLSGWSWRMLETQQQCESASRSREHGWGGKWCRNDEKKKKRGFWLLVLVTPISIYPFSPTASSSTVPLRVMLFLFPWLPNPSSTKPYPFQKFFSQSISSTNRKSTRKVNLRAAVEDWGWRRHEGTLEILRIDGKWGQNSPYVRREERILSIWDVLIPQKRTSRRRYIHSCILWTLSKQEVTPAATYRSMKWEECGWKRNQYLRMNPTANLSMFVWRNSLGLLAFPSLFNTFGFQSLLKVKQDMKSTLLRCGTGMEDARVLEIFVNACNVCTSVFLWCFLLSPSLSLDLAV